MAYVMFQYDRLTATQNWNNYNRHVRDWISQLLNLPGAVSFVAYRTTGEANSDTITMLEFRSVEEARQATTSEPMRRILNELRSVGAAAKVLVLEHSPFTPKPTLA
ncbi:hypothetical protein AAII07_45500 [Microvirga sp. 0TCS3.31]